MAAVLHLSIPVHDLAAARRFYVDTLGCRIGRERTDWIDVWFWRLQLTLQERPDEVAPRGEQGVRHFGVALEPAALGRLVERLRSAPDVDWITPLVDATDPTLNGKTSVKVADPSGNVIELKCYESWQDLDPEEETT